jgi:hypothetical protein
MSEARVTNVAALADFRAALANFAADTHRALADLDLETKRAVDWITHDRPQYWAAEVKRSQDALARAKDDLANSRTFKRIGDYTPSCAQEKKIVEAAKRRLEHAERKLQVVKQWSLAVQRAVDKFHGPIQQLLMILDGDIPRAMALLQRMSLALEKYAATNAPPAIKWEELLGQASTESMARSSDEAELTRSEPPAEQPADQEAESIKSEAATR